MSDRRRLRILLVLKHSGYIGPFGPLVQLLAGRGHAVHVASIGRAAYGLPRLEELAADPGVTYGPAPRRGPLDGWTSVAWLVRAAGDLARYADPRFDAAPAVRSRMVGKVEAHLSDTAGFDPVTRRLGIRVARLLASQTDARLAERTIRRAAALERAIPTSRRITEFIRGHQPDVVLVSPLVDLASSQLEYLKAARRLGIPTGVCVASWDNLTSKGLLRFVPERVFVWNRTQRREATELHGIPSERVVATGASRFDDWFTQRPSTERDDFVCSLGLAPSRPYLLYTCSSAFVAPNEAAFVSRWLEALRAAGDERLRSIGVVVRPHPKRTDPWRRADLSRFGNAVVWPFETEPGPASVRAGFFDSIVHSAGVVGINTSAMLETAIAGRSVFTVLAPEFAQESTVHFHYLRVEQGGFLHVASSLQEHLDQLARTLDRGAETEAETRRFVETFLRPNGIDRNATPIFADAIEELANVAPAPEAARRADLARRIALLPVAAASSMAVAGAHAPAALRSRLPDGRRCKRTSGRKRAPANAAEYIQSSRMHVPDE